MSNRGNEENASWVLKSCVFFSFVWRCSKQEIQEMPNLLIVLSDELRVSPCVTSDLDVIFGKTRTILGLLSIEQLINKNIDEGSSKVVFAIMGRTSAKSIVHKNRVKVWLQRIL